MKKAKKPGRAKKRISIAQEIAENPEFAGQLEEQGMMCAGCPLAAYETLEEGARAHGVKASAIKKRRK